MDQPIGTAELADGLPNGGTTRIALRGIQSEQFQPFKFESHEVRTVVINGEPWFVLADLCKALDLTNPSMVADRIDSDALSTTEVIDSMGRAQTARIVSEAGLYEVVFLSRKPEAKAFKRWVTHEVIPSIRKTGSYGVQKQLTDDEIVAQALQITVAKVQQLEAKIEQDAPAVEYVTNHVAVADDVVTVRVAAQHLCKKEGELRAALIDSRMIYRVLIGQRWSGKDARIVDEYEYRPYAEHADKFVMRAQHNAPRHHNGQVRQTLYVLAAALPRISKRLGLGVAA